MHRQIKAVVRDGQIQLAEKIDAPDGTEVVVSLPDVSQEPAAEKREPRMMYRGMYAKELANLRDEDLDAVKNSWKQKWDRLEDK